jgi:hypothetical protein
MLTSGQSLVFIAGAIVGGLATAIGSYSIKKLINKKKLQDKRDDSIKLSKPIFKPLFRPGVGIFIHMLLEDKYSTGLSRESLIEKSRNAILNPNSININKIGGWDSELNIIYADPINQDDLKEGKVHFDGIRVEFPECNNPRYHPVIIDTLKHKYTIVVSGLNADSRIDDNSNICAILFIKINDNDYYTIYTNNKSCFGYILTFANDNIYSIHGVDNVHSCIPPSNKSFEHLGFYLCLFYYTLNLMCDFTEMANFLILLSEEDRLNLILRFINYCNYNV